MCKCRELLDEKLKPMNAQIAVGFQLTPEDGPGRAMVLAPPQIVLEKIDDKKRGKPPTLLASFCPFCGEAYEPAEDKPPVAA